ncbi:MAG: NAD(P)H-dependent glycerol-3-phosphate dehydrogenase [Hyphomicrobium sp.]
MNIDTISVIGAGAWGTALAHALAQAGRKVMLWAREADVAEDINLRHVNRQFLPGIDLHHDVGATGDLAVAARSDCILMVVPAQHVRSVSRQLAPHLRSGQPVVMCAKGIEQDTGKLMGDVIGEALPDVTLAVLSGPSFAADVARGLPAALTLACRSEATGKALTTALSSRQMRLYWSSDIVGAELGGAVKNVLAIAAGIVAGRELGASAHAALVTRGFAELRRFSEALGARPETMMGLAGLGDLILTCGSPQSRNMSLGRQLAEGRSLADILGARTAVTEGVHTVSAVVRLARAQGIDMPISEAVDAIISGRITVDDAIVGLMQRPLKSED